MWFSCHGRQKLSLEGLHTLLSTLNVLQPPLPIFALSLLIFLDSTQVPLLPRSPSGPSLLSEFAQYLLSVSAVALMILFV